LQKVKTPLNLPPITHCFAFFEIVSKFETTCRYKSVRKKGNVVHHEKSSDRWTKVLRLCAWGECAKRLLRQILRLAQFRQQLCETEQDEQDSLCESCSPNVFQNRSRDGRPNSDIKRIPAFHSTLQYCLPHFPTDAAIWVDARIGPSRRSSMNPGCNDTLREKLTTLLPTIGEGVGTSVTAVRLSMSVAKRYSCIVSLPTDLY